MKTTQTPKVVKFNLYNRARKTVVHSPEDIFQRGVYEAILEYVSDEAFQKRQRLQVIKDLYRRMKAHQWIDKEFIQPRLMGAK